MGWARCANDMKAKDMGKDEKFWDRMADGYAKRPIEDEAAYEQKLKVTREYFRPDWDVLELGCGTGSTAVLHAPYVKHIRAVDVSERMLEIGRERAAEAGVRNITFERASVDDFEAPDGSYDAVLTLSLLHLLEDMDGAIAKICRLLKPGGVFVSSTVCVGDTMAWFKIIGPIGRFFGFMPFVKVLTRDELVQAITDGGFEIDHEWRPGKGKAVFIVAKKP